MTIIKQTDLWSTHGGSDKVYIVVLDEVEGGYTVTGHNGRRGGALTAQVKTSKSVTLEEAQKIFDKLVKEKMNGSSHYQPASQTANVATTIPDKVDTGIYPQLLNDIEEEQMEALLQDDRYGMQEKKDGHRRLLECTKQGVRGINRRGQEVPVPDWFSRQLCTLARGLERTLIDGELIGEDLWAFDMLWYDEQDIRSEPFITRYNALGAFLNNAVAPNIHYLPLVVGTVQKRMHLAEIKAANGEGVVFKLLHAPYTADRPASGGTQFKFKFWSEADVVVQARRVGKRSVAMSLFDSKGLIVEVGNVTIPINYPLPGIGEVGLVKYLYAYPNGSLYQPQWQGIRDDKVAQECLHSQLKFKPVKDRNDEEASDDKGKDDKQTN